MVASRQVQWREMWMLAVPTSLNLTILNIAGMTMIISAMRQHHRVRVGLPNPRHRIWTDRPDGRHVGSFDGNDETNCPGGRCSRWRATRILVLLRARSAEKRSGTVPIANLWMIEGRKVRDAIPGLNEAMRESSRYFEA
jgi:hypothetical protein